MKINSIRPLVFCCLIAPSLGGCSGGEQGGPNRSPALTARGKEPVDPIEALDRAEGNNSPTCYDEYRAKMAKAVARFDGDHVELIRRLTAVADEPKSPHLAMLGVVFALDSMPDAEASTALRRLVLNGPKSVSDAIRCEAAEAYCRRTRTLEDLQELIGSPVQSVRDEALRRMSRWLRDAPSERRSLPKETRESLVEGALRGGLRGNAMEVATVLSWDHDSSSAADRVDVVVALMERVADQKPYSDEPWDAGAYIAALARLSDGAPRLKSLHDSAQGRMRVLLALALGMQGSTDVKPELIEALGSTEERIVLKSIHVLAIVGDESDIATLRGLHDADAAPVTSEHSGYAIRDAVEAAVAAIRRRKAR